LRGRRDEVDAAIAVHAFRGGEVEIGEGDLPRGLGRKNPERLAEDGVVLDFHLVAIAINEKGSRRFFLGRRGRLGGGGAARVAQSLIFAHHLDFRRQVAHLRGELIFRFRLGNRRGRLLRLFISPRGHPIGINGLNAQRGASREILPAVQRTGKGRVQET
jgi:hypothetical protein